MSRIFFFIYFILFNLFNLTLFLLEYCCYAIVYMLIMVRGQRFTFLLFLIVC
ncbi:hypothetical protein RchiOBHm_Chr4g0421741 [Rosa chinensis]|uniref:Uncharacterized protein n=1 Tax=Rosa chinensis TaxID=74649 RepID=A0A2P6QY59_ROSCH|nr:hypothetical protein RchiOBHm_Chr4g0421741 [Rosa chinensis]